MQWQEIKDLVMKARYIIIGLVLTYIPKELEQSCYILNLGNHTLAIGIFVGMRIIGVCIFAYGIAYYAKKTETVKDRENY